MKRFYVLLILAVASVIYGYYVYCSEKPTKDAAPIEEQPTKVIPPPIEVLSTVDMTPVVEELPTVDMTPVVEEEPTMVTPPQIEVQTSTVPETPTAESVSQKIEEVESSLKETQGLLVKRTAVRDAYKTEFLQLIRGKGKVPEEIEQECMKKTSELEQLSWFPKARTAWGNWKDAAKDVVIFTRQNSRLEKSLQELKHVKAKLERLEENRKVYRPGEDPELDKLIAGTEVQLELEDYNNLSSAEQALIDEEVKKSINETIKKACSKIPNLELKSIEELPALPDFAALIEEPADEVQKSIYKTVSNKCKAKIKAAQKETKDSIENNQPEITCDVWLRNIEELTEIVVAWSKIEDYGKYESKKYLDALDACFADTLRFMSKPYWDSLNEGVKSLESDNNQDWDKVIESLEGLVNVHSKLIPLMATEMESPWKKITLQLKLCKELNDFKTEVIQQRLMNVIEKCPEEVKHHFPDSALDPFSTEGRKAGDRVVKVINGVEFAFRWCPTGTFTMGSPSGETERYNDETQHQVTLTKGFWMMETEVTQKQWKAVMGSLPDCGFKGDNLPVERVSWNDCQEFCKKCTQLGLPVQLPTEAQWEYACRAGSTTAYFWGNALNGDKANCNGNYPCGTTTKGKYLEKTTPVGSYEANAWGLYDMHGNVYEWCHDRYGDYPSGSVTDPAGPSSGSDRVYRGGSWGRYAWYCRSAFRHYYAPADRYGDLGFRVVKGQ